MMPPKPSLCTKLAATTPMIGTIKNGTRMRTRGRISSQPTLLRPPLALLSIRFSNPPTPDHRMKNLRRRASQAFVTKASGDLEVVPTLVHVGGLVHQRVPARDILDALQEGATVADGAGLFHRNAVRILDLFRRWLAFVPERPFGRSHVLLRRRWYRTVIAVAADEGPLPAGVVPVDVFVGGLQFLAAQMLHQAEAVAPAPIAFLVALLVDGRIDTRDLLDADGGDGRRPHRLDHDFARRHQLHRLVEGGPSSTEVARLLQLDQLFDRKVDLLLGHVAFISVLDRVGVVDLRQECRPVGDAVVQIGRIRFLDVHRLIRRDALTRNLLPVEFALGENRQKIVEFLDLLDVNTLDHAALGSEFGLPALEIRDIHGVRLGDEAIDRRRGVEVLHRDLEAKIFGGLVADRLHHGVGDADVAKLDILDLLRPYYRCADHARSGGRAGDCRSA